MTAVKRISNGDYLIYTTNPANNSVKTGNVVVVTNNFKVQGNIELSGVLNTVNLNVINNTTEVNELHVFDNNIVLNANANVQYTGNSCLVVDRVTDGNAALAWFESTDSWKITSNTSNVSLWQDVGLPAGGEYNMLHYANVGGYVQVISTDKLLFNNANSTLSLSFSNVSSTNLPTNTANAVTLAANTANGTTGGTGIYFNNDGVQGELISRRKALVYSIIF
jgi:hypothetical protein